MDLPPQTAALRMIGFSKFCGYYDRHAPVALATIRSAWTLHAGIYYDLPANTAQGMRSVRAYADLARPPAVALATTQSALGGFCGITICQAQTRRWRR
jgi:hypothetical protein